ncbi:hypothetical protein CASFOL_001785 [Castilleja foliolosa]|uniref:Replication factor A C-terminal domain-containing protein n=1 Tax=Castilleja foliolosa TaxID=1961234 RepID=A0ABD3EG13_9LAMI
MASSLSFLQEFHEIYFEISTGKAVVRSLRTLKELREEKTCCICGKKVEEVDGKKWCMHCGEYTFRDIFRYNVEVVVADETDSAKLILWNRASEKLIGEPAEDVIALYGDTARTMPDDIAEKFLGREGLTVDDEIKDVYIMKTFPDYESNSEDDSFLDDRAVNKSVQADNQVNENATKEPANEFDADAVQTPKKQKKKGSDD